MGQQVGAASETLFPSPERRGVSTTTYKGNDRELAVIGAELDAEDQVVHLLASLPETYSTLVTALEASENVPSMEVVIDRLIYEERKAKDHS